MPKHQVEKNLFYVHVIKDVTYKNLAFSDESFVSFKI